jgi:hypothetical protein
MMTQHYAYKRLYHYDRATIFSRDGKAAIGPWPLHSRGDQSEKPH